MIVFLNGKLVPKEEAVVSVFDRGFLYGDGLFETLRVFRGQPLYWTEHLERLRRGAHFLKIQLPFTPDALRAFADALIQCNNLPEAILRITLSRGIGPRGYSPRGADRPTLVMALHPAPPPANKPPQWRVITASCRLPAHEAVAEFKTCNKLPQILARAEAEAAGADEALLCNTDGHIVEAATSNLFWIQDGIICTPPLSAGILAGVTRSVVLGISQTLNLATRETSVSPTDLCRAQGVFLSLSSWGIVEIASLDGHALACSPLTERIRAAYDAVALSGE